MGIYRFISVVVFSSLCMNAFILHICLCLALSGNETDRAALLELKATITDDPFGVLNSWNQTNHFCSWYGVTCGRRHQRVTSLDLRSLKLGGFISSHVGNLSFLREMFLQNNSFGHEIPPEIGRLRRLEVLRLQNNSLSGEIPSNISRCSQLIIMNLGFNSLQGRIPKELGFYLFKLRTISILYNNLTGSIPLSLGNLSSIEVFNVNSNNLNGSIPDIFAKLVNVRLLLLEDNRLSGMIPSSLLNLSSVTDLSVTINNMQGPLPTNLGIAFPELKYFGIYDNQFSGTIPLSLSNASNLVQLGMSGNQLHGKVPSLEKLYKLQRLLIGFNNLGSGDSGDLSFVCDLTNATHLDILLISQNNFGGLLPQCTANLSSSLTRFYAPVNNISGSLPFGIENLVNLEILSLGSNQVSGQIPPGIGKLGKLYGLYMSMNALSGNIPPSLGNLTLLNQLYLNDNNLQGNIPSSLAECQKLATLSLSHNNLTGTIFEEVSGLASSYVVFDLSQNRLTGSLPKHIGSLINLEYLNVSHNMLSGAIPASLGSCIKIETLDMQGNFFQGTIPSFLVSLRGIRELNLARNNFSGTIPEFLERFQLLQLLDLSHNNLEGVVPIQGVFENLSATSVEGNSKLCGGIPEFQLPQCTNPHSKGGLSRTLKLTVSLVCGFFGASVALAILYLHLIRRRERKESKEPTSRASENFPTVSYQTLLKATDGFCSANLIGAGSFGSVYKGVLDQGETKIAVKVFNLSNPRASKSFTAECEALQNIRHRNLLKVLSAYSGFDHSGFDFKALIFEYMVNGSLEDWLHPDQVISEKNVRPRILTFSQRLNIAIDISMALDYLHHYCQTAIVHCDLKPSNVLLNDDMVGHVGDFGLVRFLPRNSGDRSSSVGVKGTIGYAPPEYGMGNEVWTQGDVYSYGILLLEMFTGKRPTDNMFQGNSNLHKFVKEALPKQVIKIVDPVLVEESVESKISANSHANEHGVCAWVETSLLAVLEVGVACSAELPRERLDISDAMANLCRIRNKLQANKIWE